MIARLLAFGLGWTAMVAVAQEEAPRAIQVTEPPVSAIPPGEERVISNSGQFRVTGGEPGDRAAIVLLAEESKTQLLQLTEEKDEWNNRKVPITITLHGKPGDPLPVRSLATSIYVSEAGYEVHLDAHLSRGIDPERFKFAVFSALIYERTLANRPAKDTETPFSVPPWLTDGLREATAWRMGQSDRRLYEALFKTGGLFKIDDLFGVGERDFEELDGAMRAAFRVSSGSLVMALLQQPQGKAGFKALLADVADFQGEMPALLRKHFPDLNLSETSLAKWVELQLANIGGQALATDILTVAETDAQLGEVLRLNFRTPEGIIEQKGISAWAEVAAMPAPERINSVRLAQDALVRLSYRCFPSYRPLLAEYQVILGSIAKNKTKDVAMQLVKLDERRSTMTAKALRGRDYLDWFEITRANKPSDEFDDYLRLKQRLEANPRRRDDNLSKYLDRMDAIFSRGVDPKEAPMSNEFIPDLPDLSPLPDR